MTYNELYKNCIDRLTTAGISEALSDTNLLFYYIIGIDRSRLFMVSGDEAKNDDVEAINEAIGLREKRIPLQHITHVQEFMGLEFSVNEDVLIPRFDTECLVEEAMLVTNDGDKVLDVCTGSGCILISLMQYKNNLRAYGCDISGKALEVAKSNAAKLCKLKNNMIKQYDEELYCGNEGHENPCFIESDLFSNIIQSDFDVIVSNPPYIKSSVIDTLEPEVREHDPMLALDGGEDGLVFYRRIATDATKHLKKNGYLLVEIGHDQGDNVKSIFNENGYKDVCIIKDLCGNDRVVKGRYA